MTWLSDHRFTHAPDTECADCRLPETAARPAARPPAPPRADARGAGTLRPDLVIRPGTNRK
jgi:hypothetical protein